MTKRRAGGAILTVALDPRSTTPRHRQLYDGLRGAILAGQIRSGTRLPSSRTLALEIGCSRNTVMTAFEQLAAEGYIEGRTGSGTTVAHAIPETRVRVPTVTSVVSRHVRALPGLSRRGVLLTKSSEGKAPTAVRAFRVGVPAREIFPTALWARLLARRARQLPQQLFGYGAAGGYGPLREAIATYLREARAVRCDAGQVIVTSGSQQAIDLTARLLLDPNDEVWIEDPCYPSAKAAFLAAGARVRPIPVDTEGIEVRAGVSRAPRAKLAYVTPSHQFPLGVIMNLPRRLALLEWAERTGSWILEDDHNSEYRYTGRPLAALQGLDTAGRVIYVGTFSKVLFPGLRLGYLVVPPRLVDAFISGRAVTDRHSATVPQAALADFITEGHFVRHIRRSRVLYAERQAALVSATRDLAGELDVTASEAGMHLVAWLAGTRDERAVAAAAADCGVEVAPLSAYRLRKAGRRALLLGYSGYTESEIREGAARLEKALRQ